VLNNVAEFVVLFMICKLGNLQAFTMNASAEALQDYLPGF